MSRPEFPAGDYISPNLERVRPDDAFPNMIVGDTSANTWPYLRREINHNWYVDRREPTVGFVSRDEASILYNSARLFDGKTCLEIGCWRGWSTVHLALGTHSLDSIDPILGDPAVHNDLIETLRRAGVADRVQLHASRSPEGIEELAARTGKRWSFAFIDGDHEGDSPLVDAEVVQRFAADDALIILHDLAAPGPAAALAYLRDHGWTTAVYQTMQILGVATRGKCHPVLHIPDPSQKWSLPKHLASFAVIGEDHRATIRRIVVALGRPGADTVPQSSIAVPEDAEELERAALGEALHAAEQTANELRTVREGHRLEVERSFDDLHVRYLKLAGTLSDQTATNSRLEADLADALGARDEARNENDCLRAEKTRLEGVLSDFHTRYQKVAGTISNQKVAQVRLEADLAHALNPRDEALAESRRLRVELERIRDRNQRSSRKLRKAHVTIQWFRSNHGTMQAIDVFARRICRPRVLLGLSRRSAMGNSAETRKILATAFSAKREGPVLPPRVLEWLSSPRTLLGLLRRCVLAGRAAAEGVLVSALRLRLVAGVMPKEATAEGSDRALARLQHRLKKATSQLTSEQRRAEEIERKLTAVEQAMLAEERALYDAQIELTKLRRVTRMDEATRAPDVSLELPR